MNIRTKQYVIASLGGSADRQPYPVGYVFPEVVGNRGPVRGVRRGEELVAEGAVRISDDFPARQSGISMRPAYDETAGGIDIDFRILVNEFSRNHFLYDRIRHLGLEGFVLDVLAAPPVWVVRGHPCDRCSENRFPAL